MPFKNYCIPKISGLVLFFYSYKIQNYQLIVPPNTIKIKLIFNKNYSGRKSLEILLFLMRLIGLLKSENKFKKLKEVIKMTNNLPKYLNERECADMTGIGIQTLRNARFNRTGIPYVKLTRSIRYSVQDILEYFESRKIQTEEYHKIGEKDVTE